MSGKHAARRPPVADVYRAFHDLVYLHKVEDLAPQMLLRPGTLYNKADADVESHAQPTLRDLVLATQATGDMRVLDALEAMFGRAAFDCSQYEETSDDALLELVTDLGKEHGEFHVAMGQALKARQFTPQSLNAVRAEAFDIVRALMTLVARLEGYVDDAAR